MRGQAKVLPTRQATRTVAPTFKPLTLAEAKKQVEIAAEVNFHDEHIERLMDIAQDTLENDTGLTLCQSTWTYKLDAFPQFIELPKRPVSSVSSIAYLDSAGNSQTWSSANWSLDTTRTFPVILKGKDVDYPEVYDDFSPITITFVAGYASVSAVPAMAKQAMLLLVSAMFSDRGDSPKSMDGEAYERLLRRLMRSNYP